MRLKHIIVLLNMRTFSSSQKKLSQKEIKNLGLAGSLKSANDIGFVDFERSKNTAFRDFYLDLENVGVLKNINPRTVIRGVSPEEKQFNTNLTWRTAIESQYYYTTYNIIEMPIGNISFTDMSIQNFSHVNNNFFIPFLNDKNINKISKSNKFKFARFRFKKETSNTNELIVQSPSGQIFVKPAVNNLASNTKKYYYKWDHNLNTIPSGYLAEYGLSQDFAIQSSGASGILSGYYVPYPTTLDSQDYVPYNIPVQIAPKFNTGNQQSVKGLLAISIGTANKKQIVYISPHGLQTGFSNTYENFNSTESKNINLTPGSKRQYATVTGLGYHQSYGPYREVKNYPSSGGLPRFRNVLPTGAKWTGNANLNIPRKEIYWDSYNWNIEVSGAKIYQSVSEIDFVLSRSSRPTFDIVGVGEMMGKYKQITGSSNEVSKVWEKTISDGKTNQFVKSIIYWDPVQNMDPIYATFGTNTNIYVSVTPNYFSDSTFTGNNMSGLNSQYSGNGSLFNSTPYRYFYRTGISRGNRRAQYPPIFFDGWHLPTQSPATFLNSFIFPSGANSTLATGNFITQGNTVITGAKFWSGNGFRYITGTFYGATGNLFSGQAISGSGVSFYNITGSQNYFLPETGIITGTNRLTYLNASGWISGYRLVPLFSGVTGNISRVSGAGSQLVLSGQAYLYPRFYSGTTSVPLGISLTQSGVQVVNNIVYLNNVPYSGYQTGTVQSWYTRQFITTVSESGSFEKYSNYIYTDGSGTNILFDVIGDYGLTGQWIMINETNRYVSGTSGYSVLFINKRKEGIASVLPRICWWDGVGKFANSGLQINNSPTPITGGYTIGRLPVGAQTYLNSNSGLSINSRKFLNILSSDGGNSIPQFGTNGGYLYLVQSSRLLYTPSQGAPLTPSTSSIPNSGSFPTKLSATGYADPLSSSKWTQQFQLTRKQKLSITTSPAASAIFDTTFVPLSTGVSSPSILNGSFYLKSRNVSRNKLVQLKSVYLDSRYINNGHVLPTGYATVPYYGDIYNYPIYNKYADDLENDGGNGINTQMENGSGAYFPEIIESGIIVGGEFIPMAAATGRYKLNPTETIVLYSGGVVEPIKQDIPLKDTLFYKLYNNAYFAEKTLATGTWDGTIPSGSYFTVELISTYFDDNFGVDSNNNLGIFYVGDNPDIASAINDAYTLQKITGAYSKVDARNDNLSYVSHAVNKDKNNSKIHAKYIARKKMQEVYNRTAKINCPEILFKNSKYQKMEKFLIDKYIEILQTGSANVSPFNTF
jgi:hypothetical protein